MDKAEANSVLSQRLAEYRSLDYGELAAKVGENVCCAIQGPSGAEYQVEIDVLWEDKPGGSVLVLGSVDDGSLRWAFLPLCESFVLTPSGEALPKAGRVARP